MKMDCCKNGLKFGGKKIDGFMIGLIFSTAFLLGLATYFGIKMGITTQISADTQVETEIEEFKHNWGNISINEGVVTKSFPIENNGATPLKLYDVKTSCMCTSAQLKTDTKTSSRFGMHEKTGSVFEIAPGETAELIVEFDPAFHGPSGVGPINRTITMRTNDGNHPSLTFQVAAMVTK